ncbi:hypothetical protein Ddye_008377 [Dipteronia dyeriana]|uniref:Uncharacterized protein n=1 Tax=Dipteronia dyeriana TaxID=168575 RepID=A0AAD9X9P1_9ROSI|nr:hypothetical protein Ddye_008377 [Dipteronia dyeriana]
MLLWKDNLDVTILSFSTGHIDAQIQSEDGFLWRFTGFYGNPKRCQRGNSWGLLKLLRMVDNLPWMVGRDVNELLSVNEKGGGADWLYAGDRNSKFIHLRATTRKKKNSITKLLDDNGILQDSEKGLARVIINYFSTLFRSSEPFLCDIASATKAIDARLNGEMSGI